MDGHNIYSIDICDMDVDDKQYSCVHIPFHLHTVYIVVSWD